MRILPESENRHLLGVCDCGNRTSKTFRSRAMNDGYKPEEIESLADFADMDLDQDLCLSCYNGLRDEWNAWRGADKGLNEKTMTAEEKMKAWHDGKRGFNLKSAGADKLRANLKICKDKGYSKEADSIKAEMDKRGLKESEIEEAIDNDGSCFDKTKTITTDEFLALSKRFPIEEVTEDGFTFYYINEPYPEDKDNSLFAKAKEHIATYDEEAGELFYLSSKEDVLFGTGLKESETGRVHPNDPDIEEITGLTDYQRDVVLDMAKCDYECGGCNIGAAEQTFAEDEDFVDAVEAAVDFYSELANLGPAGMLEYYPDLDWDPDFVAVYGEGDYDDPADDFEGADDIDDPFDEDDWGYGIEEAIENFEE